MSQKLLNLSGLGKQPTSLELHQRELKKRHSHVHLKYTMGKLVNMPVNLVFGSDKEFKKEYSNRALQHHYSAVFNARSYSTGPSDALKQSQSEVFTAALPSQVVTRP